MAAESFMPGAPEALLAPTSTDIHYQPAPTLSRIPEFDGPAGWPVGQFESEEQIYAHYLVRRGVRDRYDEELRELQALFVVHSDGGSRFADTARGVTVVTLPQLNEILSKHWDTFDTIRRKLYTYNERGERGERAGGAEALTPEERRDIGNNIAQFRRLLDMPAWRWLRDAATAQYLRSPTTQWMMFLTPEGLRRKFAFLGVYSNRAEGGADLLTRHNPLAGGDMRPPPAHAIRGETVVNVCVSGPCDCINMWGAVMPLQTVGFVVTRRGVYGDRRWGEMQVVPWSGNPAGARSPFPDTGKAPLGGSAPSPGLVQFPDASGLGVAFGYFIRVGVLVDMLGSNVPTQEDLHIMAGLPTHSAKLFGQRASTIGNERAGRLRARVRVALGGGPHHTDMC